MTKESILDNLRNNSLGYAIIAAIIGSFFQTAFTLVLTNFQINSILAFFTVFPYSILLFVVIILIFRKLIPPLKNDIDCNHKDCTSLQSEKTVSIQKLNELLNVFSQMGLTDVTTELSESLYEPQNCMPQVKRKLFFLGLLGSKWVNVPHIRNMFEKMLNRIQAQNGSVRFLLINPNCEHFNYLSSLRGGYISDESLNHFKKLMNQYSCLEVKLYEDMPSFRLIFLNDNKLVVSRYNFDKESYKESNFGWKIPHLIIDSNTKWSLYLPFEIYYEQLWNRSKNLSMLDDGGSE